jgi:putative glycosyltransferase epsD
MINSFPKTDMKKVLFVATIFKHFRAFHLPYIEWFKQQGWQVDAMANGDDLLDNVNKCYCLPIQRSPFSPDNIKAAREAKKIIECEKYDIVYCHTAMGSVLARLASIDARKKYGTKVIYVAHGFHFFKGGPKKSWFMYYPMEKYLSRFTDAIVTINEEDYQLVKTHGFHNKNTYKIPGIGINTSRLIKTSPEVRSNLREKYGYSKDTFILIYIAEYIERKNHRFIINSMKDLSKKIPNLKVLFAGRGILMEEMKELAINERVDQYIDFLGFRKDIGELIALSDVGISASRQEGLGLNLAEEMFAGLPVVATEDRGHKELVKNGFNGFLYPQLDKNTFISRLYELSSDQHLYKQMAVNAESFVKKFTLDNALKSLTEIISKY